jgi:hypothetical protein
MGKRLSYEQKKEKLLIDILNKMFEIAGHNVTFEDIKGRQDPWYTEWTMTQAQYDEWQKWGVKEIKKRMKFTDVYAQREMAMIGLNWGLKFSDPYVPKEENV